MGVFKDLLHGRRIALDGEFRIPVGCPVGARRLAGELKDLLSEHYYPDDIQIMPDGLLLTGDLAEPFRHAYTDVQATLKVASDKVQYHVEGVSRVRDLVWLWIIPLFMGAPFWWLSLWLVYRVLGYWWSRGIPERVLRESIAKLVLEHGIKVKEEDHGRNAAA